MRRFILLILFPLFTGCHDNTPPPPRVPVPAAPAVQYEPAKPLPPEAYYDMNRQPLPYDDVPLVTQQPPELPRFLDAYNRVGRPRIAVFVNRTLEGNLIPVNPTDPLASVEYARRSTTGVSVEQSASSSHTSPYHTAQNQSTDRFQSNGPADYRESLDLYLRPGQYDEASAKSLDYLAIENIFSDWLSANGQVTLISPSMVRQRLTDTQVKELQSGRPQALREIAQQLDTDILVQVQAHPTKQTSQGLQFRLIAEAFNIQGGQSLAHAVVDVPPPLDKIQLNKFTRFLARKIMDDLSNAWVPQGVNPGPTGGFGGANGVPGGAGAGTQPTTRP